MRLANGPEGYGLVSRVLHWAMAAGILAMLALGLVLVNITPSLSTLWLYALHKSFGLTLLVLVPLRLAWHRLSPPPPLAPAPAWQLAAARWTHRALYLAMLAVPLTGWIASAATGIDVIAWGITLPRIAPVSEAWDTGFFAAHEVLSYATMALVALHAAGAAWHALTARPLPGNDAGA